ASAAIAEKSVDILMRDPSRVERLRSNVRMMRDGLRQRGFETVEGPSAITPIILGATAKAIAASQRLLELGVFVIGFGYPVVPEGKARLRVQLSAAHKPEHIQRALDAFAKLGPEAAAHGTLCRRGGLAGRTPATRSRHRCTPVTGVRRRKDAPGRRRALVLGRRDGLAPRAPAGSS